MRQYLECLEIETDVAEQAEFIRIDITDMTESEIGEVKKAMNDIMKGVPYTMRRHFCGHDEGKSCSLVVEI